MSSRRGIPTPPSGSRRRSGRTGTARRGARAPPRGGTGRWRPDVAELEPLDGAVVEVDVGQLGGAEVGLPADRFVASIVSCPARAEHGEAVVLARDLGSSRGQVLDRMVGAVVAERQLVGLEPDRAAQQLVPEADAVHRQLADQLADGVHDVVERGRVAGAVGEEDRVGARCASSSAALAVHGCSSTVAPRSRRLRTIESLTPVSIIAIRIPLHRRRSPSSTTGSRGVTSRARSRPVIAGSAAISSRPRRLGHRGREQPAAHRSLRRGCGARARACRGR